MALSKLVPELYCSDFNRSLAFYTQQLGFQILYQRPEDKFAYLSREGAEVMIEELGVGRNWITAELKPPFGRGMNLQIAVSDVVKLYNSLQNSGVAFFLPLEEKWYRRDDVFVGNHQFIVQDPDGYLLRFAQDLGSRSHS